MRRSRSALVAISFGDYDKLGPQPLLTSSKYPCILFTDKESEFVEPPWVQVVVEPPVPGDSVRSQRAVKHLLHEYLADYDHCIYLDNTVRLKVRPEDLINKFGVRKSWIFLHSFNFSLREEFSAVSRGLILDDPKILIDQLSELRGLVERPLDLRTLWTGMLLRNLRDKRLNEQFEQLNRFVNRFSKRDQLAAPAFILPTRKVKFLELDNKDSPVHSWPQYRERRESARSFAAEFPHEFVPLISGEDSIHLNLLRNMLLDKT